MALTPGKAQKPYGAFISAARHAQPGELLFLPSKCRFAPNGLNARKARKPYGAFISAARHAQPGELLFLPLKCRFAPNRLTPEKAENSASSLTELRTLDGSVPRALLPFARIMKFPA